MTGLEEDIFVYSFVCLLIIISSSTFELTTQPGIDTLNDL